MKKVSVLITGIIIMGFSPSHAQGRISVIGGLTADCIYKSKILKLDHTILSEPFFLNNSYSLNPQAVTRFSFGGFINVMYRSGISINLDLAYAQEHSQLNFDNYANNWSYKMKFNYNYINILPAFRWYPLNKSQNCREDEMPEDYKAGLYISAGMQFGLQLKEEAITYKSEGPGVLPAFGTDQEQEGQLNNVLKGRTNIGIVFGVGYEFYKPAPVAINIKCHRGISDVVETLPNSYNFVSDNNPNNFWQFGLAFFIGRSGRFPIARKGF